MTASRTRRSRSESSGNGISSNLLTTSDNCQVCGERIESQPAERGKLEPTPVHGSPPCGDPRLNAGNLGHRQPQPVDCSEPQIHLLGYSVRRSQGFLAFDRIHALPEKAQPFDIAADVPAAADG